jgi:Fic family protein
LKRGLTGHYEVIRAGSEEVRAFILHNDAILQKPLLYLSLYFKQHRNEYYRLLDLVRTEGDWEAWVDFFLEGVVKTAQNAVQTAQRLVALFKEDTQKIQTVGRVASTALRVFNALCERPILTLNEACRRTRGSFPSVSKEMEALAKLNIAREITGRKRDRIFAYDNHLRILTEGTEPL